MDETRAVGSNSGTKEDASPVTDEDFACGKVAWELFQGTDGGGWGQTLDREGSESDDILTL